MMNLIAEKIEQYLISDEIELNSVENILELFFLIIDDLPYGISINRILTNEKGEPNDYKILYLNKESLKFYDKNKEEIVGNNYSNIFQIDEQKKKEIKQLGRISLKGGNIRYEIYDEDKDKWYQYVAFSPLKEIFVITLIDVSDSKKLQLNFAEIIKSLEDQLVSRTMKLQETIESLQIEVSERKFVEQQLLEAREELQILLKNEQKIRELKEKFLNILVQEFRDPLTVIKTSIDLLKIIQKRSKIEISNDIFERMEKSINQLVDSMDNVHLIAEEEIKTSVEKVNIDMVSSCYEIIEEIKVFDEYQHQIFFKHNYEKFICSTDKVLIQAILRILLKNACQYSKSEKPIIVELKEEDNLVQLIVQDFGVGIPDNELPLVFEPLYRGTNVSHTFGSGLGLSIVKKYVEMLNAEIHVISKVNEGTQFIVALRKEKCS
ncbi:MAG: ATP-binding protein [Candidatus Kapaibacteriota bacterium]